jgi:uncharacterized protein (TIGR02302 family)
MIDRMVELTQIQIERKITVARLALGWEALWAALCWPLILGMGLTSLILSGLLPLLPDFARYGVLLAAIGALIWSLRSVFKINRPSAYEAMRRIEAQSSLFNRPVSTAKDTLAETGLDERSVALWEEHKRRQLALLVSLKVGTPRSRWRDLDPLSLRVPACIALVASLFLVPEDSLFNLQNTFRVGPVVAQKPLTLDAWLKPPAYTGKPPLLLTSPAEIEKLKTDNEILVPENATLTLRLDGAKAPRLGFYDVSGDNPKELEELAAKTRFENGLFQADAKLNRPALVKIYDGDKELAAWHVSVIPDQPPTITILGEPKTAGLGAVTLSWKATDDYGVAGITSQIYLSDNQEDGVGFTNNGVFLFDPPNFPISLRKSAPKEELGSTSADLTPHPWAGLMVDLTLEVTDAAKHKITSVVKTFKLPERLFTKPLARALVEQRKTLIMDPATSQNVQKLLSALLIYPQGLIESSGPHIAIASVISRLRNSGDASDLNEAQNMLWQIAVSVEDGNLSDARKDVEAARKALEKALAEGASPEELKQLMQKLRKAMDRYMESMNEEAKKRQAQGQKNRSSKNSKTITQEDIQKMLDTIEKLSQNGAKDAAQEMLSQLEDILKNMEPGMAQQGDQQDPSAANEMLNELSEMMRKQQELMDKTQRQPQPGEGDQLNREGDDPGNRSGNEGANGLAGEQGDLARQLEQFMKGLGKNGLQSPPSLGEAGKQMGEAQQSLEQKDREQALGQQGEALNQLREGAQNMVRQLQQAGKSGQDNNGKEGQAKGDSKDPLGRPRPSKDDQYGPDKNMLPSELAIRRAREILESLRARANTPNLPRIDKDYIERLLRGLY